MQNIRGMDDQLPSNIIFEILSRLPVKSVVRLRCVSKQWCEYIDDPYLRIIHHGRAAEEPTPIMFHQALDDFVGSHTLYIHLAKSKQVGEGTTRPHVLEHKKNPIFEFKSLVRVRIRGSCNGLLYFPDATKLVAIHPLRKEYYELPLLHLPLSLQNAGIHESSGLGFDASANTFKMCVAVKNLCTMVHVFGTNSWREIPKVPSYPICGGGIFAHGCVHWLVSYHDKPTNEGREVIWFDVTHEEFGLINTPKTIGVRSYYDHLVDIDGEVGLVCNNPNGRVEIWILKQKEWVLHVRFEKKYLPDGIIKVLGCWNKDGDISISIAAKRKFWFFVYSLKGGVFNGVHGFDEGIIMYSDNIICHQRKSPFDMIKEKEKD